MSASEFTTILKSLQPELVAQAAAVLESAGIPYQNPGYQTASLLPLVNFVNIELRVPTDRLQDARRAIGDIAELVRDGAEKGHAVFRIRRDNGAVFAIAGGVIGIVIAIVLPAVVADLPTWAFPAALLGTPVLGFIWGTRVGKDYCSSPGCPGDLAADATVCPRCAGNIRGRINTASEHLEAAEAQGMGGEERVT